MAMTLSPDLRREYEMLFAQMEIRPERRAEIACYHARLTAPEAVQQYREVELKTGVPWFVVAIIHSLECSQRFKCHLHNGDPLTARTIQVPAGRPEFGAPPFTWIASAIDALTFDKLTGWTDWSLAGIAFVLEGFNGWGYRKRFPCVKSPYLWSFSTVYSCGKFVGDGVFSSSAVSQQCGAMVLLDALIRANPQIAQKIGFQVPPAEDGSGAPFPKTEGPDDVEPSTPTAPSAGRAPRYPGRYLQSVMEDDPDVRLVQMRLKVIGIDPGTIDGDFGAVTDRAVRLFQARSANPAGEPLEIDGVVGPETWAALFGPDSVATGPDEPAPGEVPQPAAASLAAAVIAVAEREVGVREQPIGSNRGSRVDQYIRAAGLDPAESSTPWCMCFVYWCFAAAARTLDVANLVPRNGSVHLAWNATQRLDQPVVVVTAMEARNNPALVKPGMAFFLDTGGDRGHAGLVIANINGRLETIEGNTTSISGSRDGIGVFRRSRRNVSDGSLMGFAGYG